MTEIFKKMKMNEKFKKETFYWFHQTLEQRNAAFKCVFSHNLQLRRSRRD